MKLGRKLKKLLDGTHPIPATNVPITPLVVPDTRSASDGKLTAQDIQSIQTFSIEPGKKFAKGHSFERDMADLSIAYVLQESPELKKLIRLIVEIRDLDSERQLTEVLEKCARFSVRLASAPHTHRAEATLAITSFHETVLKLKTHVEKSKEELTSIIDEGIDRIEPSFICNNKLETREGLSRVLDITLGPTVDTLTLFKNASSLIPVPWVQPLIGTVVNILQAVSQTRTNYKEMRQIASISGEFVVSCAVLCSESTVGPLLKSSLKKLSDTLRNIAEECDKLCQLGLFSRYLRQSGHAGDLQGIRKRLDIAIQLFQTENSINIKLDTEELNRKFDFAALNTLPSHPRYTRNEYFEKSRDDVIKDLSDWISNAPEPVLWMHGAAGLGKSTVAQEFVYLLKSEDRLAGGVFLTNLNAEFPETVVQMISRQLGEMYPSIVAIIAEASRKLQGPHNSLQDHFMAYIFDPIRALNYPYPLVVIVDGLDEWKNHASFLAELALITSSNLVKFVLTSRFIYSIERALNDLSGMVHTYSLPLASQDVIASYFCHHFSSGTIDWRGRKPDNAIISRLAARAGGLLIWAATVRSLVTSEFSSEYPHKILEQLLISEEQVISQKDGQAQTQLHNLYRRALTTLFPSHVHAKLQTFLAATLVLQETMSIGDFARLLGISEPAILDIRRRLSALQSQGDPKSIFVAPALQQFHASFIEFITTDSDDQTCMAINAGKAHQILGQKCLNVVFTEFLPSFRGKKSKYFELHGAELYAVKFWPLHLSNGMPDQPTETSDTGQSLDLVSEDALHRWAALFLPFISSRFEKNTISFDGIRKTDLFYEIALMIEEEGEEGEEDIKSLQYYIQCLKIAIKFQPHHLKTWRALAFAYNRLYEQSGSDEDLDEMINVYQCSLQEAHDGDPTDYSALLNNLAVSLSTRFEQQGARSDLDSAISIHEKVLDLRPKSHPDRSESLNNLAVSFRLRFEQQGAIDDLEKAIFMHREALQLRPGSHADRASSLNNLANSLQAYFEQRGNQNHLDEAISMHREALQLRPGSHPNRTNTLNNLALCLQTRFDQQLGAQSDIDEAIFMHRESLQLCAGSGSHSDRFNALNNLANSLQSRFECQQGNKNDLDEAISMHREALQLCPGSHLNRSASLNNLARSLHTRFKHQGALSDLEEAISMHREALQLRPGSHPDRHQSLNNLALCLQTLFEQQGSQSELDEAIFLHKEALELRAGSHPDRSDSLNSLVLCLQTRFDLQQTQSDLDDAILLLREAVVCQPAPHPDSSEQLMNLASCLQLRFNQTRLLHDITEVISVCQQLLDYPAEDSCHAWALELLPEALKERDALNIGNDEMERAVMCDVMHSG